MILIHHKQLLRDKSVAEIDDKTHHYLEIINKNSERMYHLIRDLIDSTKVNLGQIKMFSTNLDVYPILNEIKEIMAEIFKDKQIIPVFHIENNLPNINADPGRVIYILKNLLMNAVQATESGGTVTLKIYKNGKGVQFEVEDTGIGISEENQKYIFNRFYQVKYPVAKQFTGPGLGLSICNGLLELMGGVIWFESAPGKGSKFYFTLPIGVNIK
ncbi:MAG: HAMP domain-containing sensor histidine kinase [Nanoarchaeota archaeon]|nr:HAMP domain-containing sensor histidine kinase [Nanoarchaeota archaeon]